MAELLLSVVAERIIGTLGSLAAKEIRLLWGVQDEVESLKNTISTIKDVLLDAEEKKAAGDRAVKGWLERLEDAMYDADDLLDEVSTEALRREVMTRDKKAKKVRIFFSKSNQLGFRRKIASKIKAIRKRLDAINVDKRFHLEVRQVEETRVGNRERDTTHSFVRAEEVIGRKKDKKAVIDLLMDSSVKENVSILPIVGIGGLGKTTLAQFIFNDHQIQKHFELKMWVCVSDIFDVKDIVAKVLESVTKEKPKDAEMDTLVANLREKIEGKKYFLVLDDVWNGDHGKWCRLKQVLMGGARGTRIVVTTRNEIVAKTIRQESIVGIIGTVKSYSLKGLDEDASWSLFKQKAFERGQEPENSSIVALGKEIVKKCSGVPLAISTIGSLLGSKNSEAEWVYFKNNELLKISQNENDILSTLKLSYDHLPSHLKHCFAYCSLFPKGYKIKKSTLIKLWIAQGFVKSFDDQEAEMEDVGNGYFMNLLLRSFFQEAEMDEFGNVIECKMHDLMHDLAISVAGSLITTLDDKKRNINEKARHVSVAYGITISCEVSTSLCKASRMRTFLCFGKNFEANIVCDATFSSSNSLRVLYFYDKWPVDRFIRKLKHLRYLDLSGNGEVKKLPDSITNLQNLQTLRLSYCWSLEELPGDIKKLVNLRHLEIDGCNLSYMPLGLGQLANLQTLSTFYVHSANSHSRHSGSSGLQELKGLNKLRGELRIKNLGHEKGVASECKAASLNEKQHLRTLRIQWSAEGDVENSDVVEDETSLNGFQPHSNLKKLFLRDYRGLKLPSWILLLITNLVRFELQSCRKIQYLPQLSQLRSLKELSLMNLEAIEYISDDGASNEFSSSSTAPTPPFFQSLNYIKFHDCPNLKGWWKRRDSSVVVNSDNSIEMTEHHLLPSFPRLSKLEILHCLMLTSMPMFPHLEEELHLWSASSKPLQQTMMINMAAPQSPTSTAINSSSFTPLSKLKSIEFDSITDLETLPLQNLTSLESLKIQGCQILKSLSLGIHLTALQVLVIVNCPNLELANVEDGMQWQGRTSLLSIRFSGLPKLMSLPSGLQHATTLQELKIWNCESLMAIPEWIHNCKSLQLLDIRKCFRLASLPKGISQLTSLQTLDIEDCPNLEHANDEDEIKGQGLTSLLSIRFSGLPKLVSLPSGLQHATSLQTLQIWDCECLTAIPEWIHNCKSLQLLEIRKCSRLASLPKGISQLTSLQTLDIEDCPNLKLANDEDGMQWQGLTSLLSIRFSGLPKLMSLPSRLQHATSLQTLHIWDCERLTVIPKWIHNCKSLQLLEIRKCSRLASLPKGISQLTSLHTLYIEDCPNLKLANDEDGMQWQGLTSLLSIHFSGLPKLVSFPSGLQHATSLQKLQIWDCESLIAIPEWIHNCKSLQLLEIRKCSRLASLPKGISQLTSLQTLDIEDCPNLKLANDEDRMQWQGLTSLLSIHLSGLPKLVSLPSGLQHATSLQKLQIWDCKRLTAIPEWIHNCKSLQLLEIRKCSRLASLPKGISQLTSLQTLDIEDCPNLKLANDEDGMQWQGLMSLLSIRFSGLPKLVSLPSGLQHATTLQKLKIWRCESLTAIPEWIHNCKSLQLLEIDECSRLASLPKGISRLTSLQKLDIMDCPDLEIANDEDGMQLQGLTSLLSLWFSGLPKLVSLPSGLQHATTLQELKIWRCESLTAIPKWIHNCKSLQLLDIRKCSRLESLPKGISQLTSLQTLDIEDCPNLELANNENGMQWQGLTSLLSIRFSGLPKLVSLPSGLQHATTLQELQIWNCKSLTAIPEWIHNCKSLQLFDIRKCSRLVSLPKGISQLTSLQTLDIEDCPNLKLANDEDGMQWQDLTSLLSIRFSGLPKLVSLPSGLQHATTLQKLQIWRCESLTAIPEWIHYYKSLQLLEIDECSRLASLPKGISQLTSLQTLDIADCPNLKLANDEDEMQWHGLTSLLSICFLGLPKLVSLPSGLQHATTLQELQIWRCESLTTIPEWIHHCKSLQVLEIDECSRLASLPEGMRRLTSLPELTIVNCPNLELANDEDGMQWQGLTSLLSIHFSGLSKLVSLPSGIQHATALQKLQIWDCGSLTAIPEWIHHCKSLQLLEIDECSRLASLPEGISRLTSLQRLTIRNCPILLQRCKRHTGEDWPKIAHIPELDL